MSEGPDAETIRYKTYLEERHRYIDADVKNLEQFDKAIITLTSGAFGLTVTFVANIFKTIQPGTLGYLQCAMFCFAGSMLSTLFSFQSSHFAATHQIYLLDDEYRSNHKKPKRTGIVWVTIVLNLTSLVLFSVGTVYLSFFVLNNLKEGALK